MQKAFTLIELVIVGAILGILAAVVSASVQGHSQDARESLTKDHLRYIRTMITKYEFDHDGARPGYVDGITKNETVTQNQFIYCTDVLGQSSLSKTPSDEYPLGPYIHELPKNPFNGLSTIEIINEFEKFAEKADGKHSGWLYNRETGNIGCNSVGVDCEGVYHYAY